MPNAVAVHIVLDTAPSCAGCIAEIQGVLDGLEGASGLVATPKQREIVVQVDPGKLEAQTVVEALTAAGRPGRIAG
jgi:copper chaperone CopZ